MLVTRIITALILGSAVAAAVWLLPAAAAAAAFAVLWLAGAWEWAGLCRWQRPARAAYTVMFAVLMLAAPWWALQPAASTAIVALATVWWLAALAGVLSYPRPIPQWVPPLAGVFALLPAWAVLAYLLAAPQGAALAFTVLVLVWAADVGAYAFGRALGRVKLAPEVSPGKTWEGVIGGLLLAAAAAWVAGGLLGRPAGTMVAIGVAAALASVLGDLTVSVLKRNADVKDTGRLLPGHGGVMDRIDSLTAAVPIYVLGLKLAGWVA